MEQRMGQTKEQKAQFEASLQRAAEKREARESKARKRPKFTIEALESVLVGLAYLTKVDGKPAVEAFERAEKCYNAMKRAEALLEKFSIRTPEDFDTYIARTGHLFNE
jgi:hypothetical protein